MTFSNTVRHGKSTGSWNTIPTLRLGPATRRPSSSTLPDDAASKPPRTRSRVVLPQPEGPTIVTNSPAATSSVTSASARIREPARVRYVFSRRDTAISGEVILGMVRCGKPWAQGGFGGCLEFDHGLTCMRGKAMLSLMTGNRLRLGLFGANCSSGRTYAVLPESWQASWENNLKLAQMADDLGIECMVPIARWK